MVKDWKVPEYALFGEIEPFPDVVHCEHIKDRAAGHSWHIAPHRHAKLAQIIYIESGHAEAVAEGKSFHLKDDVVFYVPAQAVHSFTFAPHTQGMVQSFPLSILRSIGPVDAGISRTLSRPFVADPGAHLQALMSLLDALLSGSGPYRAQTVVGLAHAVLAATATAGTTHLDDARSDMDVRLIQLDQLISDHQEAGWTARDYSAALGLSTGHLSRLCRAAYGISASTYIEASTVQEACRLLAFTQLSVAEIGYRLGFSDPSYFSRRFRFLQGETPTVYRRHFVS